MVRAQIVMEPRAANNKLDKTILLEAFEELSDELAQRGLRATAYIVGGSALILGHHQARTTIDVDALFLDQSKVVLPMAESIARKKGLPLNWLNTEVQQVLQVELVRDTSAVSVFQSPSLVVTGASAEHLLAMKMHAGRAVDLADITFLAKKIGVESYHEALKIYDSIFPTRSLFLDEDSITTAIELAQAPEE